MDKVFIESRSVSLDTMSLAYQRSHTVAVGKATKSSTGLAYKPSHTTGRTTEYFWRAWEGVGHDNLNARYLQSSRGQFLSQDPVFWGGKQDLANPQSLNSYSYANGNPITLSDPNGTAASMSSILSGFVSLLQSFLGFLQGGGSGGGAAAGSSGVQVSPNQSSAQSSNASKSIQLQPSGGFVTQKTPTGCFDACVEMLGYRPDPANRIVTSALSNGQLTPQSGAKQGIQTIDSYLTAGNPIMVGVNWNGKTQEGNANPGTQHFVVIVGSGSDSGGKYYNFYDPGTTYQAKGTSQDNKLYVNGNTLSGKSVYNQTTKTYTVTEVCPK